MSLICFKYLRHFIIYSIVLIYSTNVESKCRRFDDKVLDELNYEQLSGHWNLYASSLEGDTIVSFAYHKIEDNSISFEQTNITGHTDRSVIPDVTQKRKMSGIQLKFWTLKADPSNYLVTYQCSKALVGGKKSKAKESKEIYRIWSRSDSIDDSTYDQLKTFLEQISPDIHLSEVSLTPQSGLTSKPSESQQSDTQTSGDSNLNIGEPAKPKSVSRGSIIFGVIPPDPAYVMPDTHLSEPRLPDKPDVREPDVGMKESSKDSVKARNFGNRLSEQFKTRRNKSPKTPK